MEAALRDWLLAQSAISALVSGRIHWDERPQAEDLPGVMLTYVSGPREHEMDGPSVLVGSRIQVDIWGETKASALAVRDAVRDAAAAYASGDATGIGAVLLVGERQFPGPQSDRVPPAQRLFNAQLDLTIWHTE